MKTASMIGLKELRENTEDYISKVKKGESFLVLRKSKPVFRISNPDNDENSVWEEVVDFTKLKKGGIEASQLLSRLEKLWTK